MRRWQHEDTGRICEAVYCPGNRWYEIPGFEAEIKTSQECGAMTPKEAEAKCRCGGDKDDCHGTQLWPDY